MRTTNAIADLRQQIHRTVCARCGVEIPADAPDGCCPGCLLQGGLNLLPEEAVTTIVDLRQDEGVRPVESNSKDDADSFASTEARFGIYEIERHPDGSLYELGRGGMGVTYRAVDRTLRRKVALKVIRTAVAMGNTEARERFLREARAAAALRHQNIANSSTRWN